MTDPKEFEGILDLAVKQLNGDVRSNKAYHDPLAFEKRVLEVLVEVAEGRGIKVDRTCHPHAFPDIRVNGFGVELKSTNVAAMRLGLPAIGVEIEERHCESAAQRLRAERAAPRIVFA